MATKKKISINAFENVMKERYIPTETVSWYGIEVTIKKTLSLNAMLSFVADVVHSCFSDTGEYIPEIMDFAIRTNVMEKYTNFTLPQNLENQYALVYQTDAFEMILEMINLEQYSEMIKAIKSKVDMLARSNIEAINIQMNSVCKTLEEMQDSFGNIFGAINSEDIGAIIGAISGGQINEKSIVDAYISSHKEGGDKNTN